MNSPWLSGSLLTKSRSVEINAIDSETELGQLIDNFRAKVYYCVFLRMIYIECLSYYIYRKHFHYSEMLLW